MRGMIVREIRFQSWVSRKGMTGWTFRMHWRFAGAHAEVDVVLERHRNEVGHRILGFPGELGVVLGPGEPWQRCITSRSTSAALPPVERDDFRSTFPPRASSSSSAPTHLALGDLWMPGGLPVHLDRATHRSGHLSKVDAPMHAPN
jgi:hypothetical protein